MENFFLFFFFVCNIELKMTPKDNSKKKFNQMITVLTYICMYPYSINHTRKKNQDKNHEIQYFMEKRSGTNVKLSLNRVIDLYTRPNGIVVVRNWLLRKKRSFHFRFAVVSRVS